jgi:hypothetical protein
MRSAFWCIPLTRSNFRIFRGFLCIMLVKHVVHRRASPIWKLSSIKRLATCRARCIARYSDFGFSMNEGD